MDRVNWTEWVLERKKMPVFKVAILCGGWGQGGSWWWWRWCVGVGLWVCKWGLYGGHWVWGCVYWDGVCLRVGGVCEFWTSVIVFANIHYKHEYSVLNSIWPKSGLSELRKNTLQLSQTDLLVFHSDYYIIKAKKSKKVYLTYLPTWGCGFPFTTLLN